MPDDKFMEFVKERDKAGAIAYWLSDLEGMSMLEHACQKMIRGWCDPRDVETIGALDGFRTERAAVVFGALFDA